MEEIVSQAALRKRIDHKKSPIAGAFSS